MHCCVVTAHYSLVTSDFAGITLHLVANAQAISEFSSKAAVSLYLLLQKSAMVLSLSRAESKKLKDDFKSYMKHHWREVLGDGGVLQGMKDLETRLLDSEAFDVRHKVTKLD